MHNAVSVEAIDFDDEGHCVFPSQLSGLAPPISMPAKLDQFLALAETMLPDHEALLQRFELLIRPISIPRTDLKRVDASKIIVMSPTIGHTSTAYDFASPEDQLIFLSNQTLATGWEITRQALLSLGATVEVADDIYEETGIAPITASDGVRLPVQQTFARDSGIVVGGSYLAPSEEALYRTTINVLETSNGIIIPRGSPADKYAQLMAGLKPRHALSIINAYHAAGKHLALRPVDAFFEGGDVIADPRKGIVLIGKDQAYDHKFSSLRSNAASLRQAFAAVAGERSAPVFIERPCTEYSADRGEGERFHLDCFMSLLPNGEMLVDPRFTTPASFKQLQQIYGDNLITIDPDNPVTTTGPLGRGDVPNYTANLVAVGHALLMPSCSQTLKQKLRQRGYTVFTAQDLGTTPGAFYMRGGGMHCITQDFPAP